jgi:hypothetical protein
VFALPRGQAGALQLVPYKGKPVLSLLGRHDFRHQLPWRLSAGDVFAVGLSLIRVIYVGVDAAAFATAAADAPSRGSAEHGTVRAADGRLLVVFEDDGGKFQRSQAKVEKRSAKLAAQEVAEAAERAAAGAASAASAVAGSSAGASTTVGGGSGGSGGGGSGGGGSGRGSRTSGDGDDAEGVSDIGGETGGEDEGEGEEEEGYDEEVTGLDLTWLHLT